MMHIKHARTGFVYMKIYILVSPYSLINTFDVIFVKYKGVNFCSQC